MDERGVLGDEDWTKLHHSAEIGEPISLEAITISTEQLAALISAATNDAAFKDLPADVPTIASGSSFRGCKFEAGSSFHSIRLNGCDFSEADLFNTDFYKATLSDTTFSHSSLINAILIDAKLASLHFESSDLTNAKFYRSRISQALFSGADLTKCSFREAVLYKCDFSRATLRRTSFRETSLTGCRFSMVSLTNANFRDSNIVETEFSEVMWDPAHPPVWPRNFTPPLNSCQDGAATL